MASDSLKKPLDIHLHPATENYLEGCMKPYIAELRRYFRLELPVMTEEEMVTDLKKQNVRGVLLGWDAETHTGCPPLDNRWVSKVIQKHPELFVCGFGSVDPHKSNALDEMKRCVLEYGLKGFKFHASAQAFYPNDKKAEPLFAFCQDQKVPVLFHTGMTGLGAGMPGGGGIQLEFTRPLPYLDDLATHFPELTIIAAHPAWPYQEEMIAICLHKANVYMDLSGWSPKYFPESLKQNLKRLYKKALFGSDYPFIRPERWLDDFEALGLDKSKKEHILWKNAETILQMKEET